MESGLIQSSPVDVSVIQWRNGASVVSNVLSEFEIRDLPQSKLPPGSLTLGFLRGILGELSEQWLAIVGSRLDTAAVNLALAGLRAEVDGLIAGVQGLQDDSGRPIDFGTIAGVKLSIGQQQLTDADRILLAVLQAIAAPRADFPGAVMAQTRERSAAVQSMTSAGSVRELAELLFETADRGEVPPEDVWLLFHAAPRTVAGPALQEEHLGIGESLIVFADGFMAGVLAHAAFWPASAPLAADLFLIGAGLYFVGLGIAGLENPELAGHVEDVVLESLRNTARNVESLRGAAQGAVSRIALSTRDLLTHLASAVSTPPPAARIDIVSSSNSDLAHTTYEDQAKPGASFTVQLNRRPEFPVSIALGVDKPSEASIVSSDGAGVEEVTLLFSDDWYWPKSIVIKGRDDDVVDGDQDYQLVVKSVASQDERYNGLGVSPIDLVNVDNDRLRLSIDDTRVNEGPSGTTSNAIFFVSVDKLNLEPITFQYWTIDGSARAGVDYQAVAPTTKTIVAGGQFAALSIPVIGNDKDQDDRDFFVKVAVNDSSVEVARDQGTATIRDDDEAGMVVDCGTGELFTTERREPDKTVTCSVKLASEPSKAVRLGLSSTDTSEGAVSPSSLRFSPGDWNKPQSLTVRGVDDTIEDGDVPYNIIIAPSSGDSDYSRLEPQPISLVNRDDELVVFAATFEAHPLYTLEPPGRVCIWEHDLSVTLVARVGRPVFNGRTFGTLTVTATDSVTQVSGSCSSDVGPRGPIEGTQAGGIYGRASDETIRASTDSTGFRWGAFLEDGIINGDTFIATIRIIDGSDLDDHLLVDLTLTRQT
jgi:hypothetical protein